MIKVIETNLMLKQGCDIKDHQSRVVEVESWEEYIEEIQSGKSVDRKCCIGWMRGCTIPRKCKVLDFVSDEYHASCTVVLWDGCITKKLMYRVNDGSLSN